MPGKFLLENFFPYLQSLTEFLALKFLSKGNEYTEVDSRYLEFQGTL